MTERPPGWPNAGSVANFIRGLDFPTSFEPVEQIDAYLAERRRTALAKEQDRLTLDELEAIQKARAYHLKRKEIRDAQEEKRRPGGGRR